MTFLSLTYIFVIINIGLVVGLNFTDAEVANLRASCKNKTLPPNNQQNGHTGVSLHGQNESYQWLVRVRLKDGTEGKDLYDSGGSFISTRHVMANSQSISTGKKKWALNGADIGSSCNNDPVMGSLGIEEVPSDVVDKMEVVIEKCQNSRTRNVTSAYVFNICANAHSKYKSHYAPMLVEIEGEPNEEYACLADTSTIYKEGDKVHMYGIEYENNARSESEWKHRNDPIEDFYSEWIRTLKQGSDRPLAKGDRGGPLVTDDGVLIGFGSTFALADNAENHYFFDIKYLSSEICYLTNICDIYSPSTTTTPTTTTPTTTTPTTTTKITASTSKPPALNETVSTITLKSVVRPTTPITYLNLEEHEELDKENDKENDNIDVDTDLYLSADFLNNSPREAVSIIIAIVGILTLLNIL